jgi:hypothetical protein
VLHSRTKHIEVRYHFLRDNVEKGNIDLIHAPTEKQLADILTKPLDQATFARLRGELAVVFPFELRLVGLMYICMLHFLLCIISCLHHCIIDCICNICHRYVLLSYARYEVMTLLVMLRILYSYALSSFGIYMLVNGFLLYKMLYDPLLWVECFSCSNWVLMAISCLICAWDHVLFIWDQRSIHHHECLAYMLPCGEA